MIVDANCTEEPETDEKWGDEKWRDESVDDLDREKMGNSATEPLKLLSQRIQVFVLLAVQRCP